MYRDVQNVFTSLYVNTYVRIVSVVVFRFSFVFSKNENSPSRVLFVRSFTATANGATCTLESRSDCMGPLHECSGAYHNSE